MRIEGLVQLKTGDAVTGAISRRWPWFRWLRVDNVTAVSAKDPAHPTKIPGCVYVPKSNVSFVQRVDLVQSAPTQ